MMSGLKSDCRKFSPNVFNKSKCQNCFRTKESHSAEALENNRASRNVSKCGYLFVAPDWDFNVSVNRTKRWQRRWFVLYDDGELTYALDEFPDTIPQGTIDMNKVLDVSDAEGITGNDFAISITTPDKVHFIKGTSKEESKWWFDVLCRVSPRHMSRAKHKRNATFPCGKATIPTPAVITQEYSCEDDMRLNSFSRPKFLSTSAMSQNWLPAADIEDEDVFAGRESSPYILDSNNKTKRDVEVHNALNKLISLPEDAFNEPDSEISAEIVVEKAPKDYLSELEESENRRRNRRYLKRENRIQRNQRSRNDGVSKMIPSKTANKCSPSDSQQNSNASAIAAAEKLEYLESIHTKNDRGSFTKKDVITENEISDILVTKNVKKPVAKTNLRKSESLKNIPTEMESEMKDHVSGLRRYHSFKGSSSHRKIKSSSGTSSLKRTKSTSAGLPRETSTPIKKSQGALSSSSSPCSTIPPTTNASYENINEDTFTRTGWLMRQTLTKDWSKHWFVLKDSSLTYYRDPSAEHSGIMDGILDLNQVSTIREMESDKYYAICLRMWDGKKHVLAAETEEFRNIWIQALQYASNLWSSASKEDFICTEIVLPEHNFHQNDRMERISSPSSLLSLSYAEEENHDELDCSSYSSDEQSEYFSLVDEDEISDLSSSPRTLPPSPPINRNVISLVKEKSRTRCNHGSKMNPLATTCSEVMCDYKNMKNTESTHYQDVCPKQQDNIRAIRDEDTGVFFDDHIISDDYMPTSPITPPVEFMNSNTFPIAEKSSKHEEPQKKINVSASDLKIDDSKECSMCSTIRSRLNVAQEEIRKLEKELKEAHTSFDNLEMFSYKLTQDMKLREDSYNSQIALMTSKIDDLTSKFTFAEKNYRQLKHKTQKSEGKERRRSSLKSREGLSLTKEYETKLCDLESKMQFFESSLKKEPYEVDESERSLSQCSSRLSEIGNGTSESSETHTPTEAVCNENKGFFSRLQSLISKVDNINGVFSTKSESNNPKICLPSKSSDDLNSSYELDEWRTQSPGDVPQNLENYCQNPINYPKTLSECQTMLSQKLNNHFEWLKCSLESIYESKTESAAKEKQQFLHVHNLSRELTDLNCEIIPNTLAEQKSLLLSEVVKALKSIDTHTNVNSILKMNTVKDIYKTIFHTMCTTFAEYEYGDFPHAFITTIPQFNFFCPSSNKFLARTPENSTHLNLSDRLGLLETQFDDTLASLKHAKLVRYESLWNILAEVPVQDDPVNKPVEVDSIVRCTTSLAIDIHRIAEFQLTNVPKLTQFSSKPEQDFMHQLYKESRETLQSNVTTFLDELKEKCPMINECTVSFYKLNESTRSNIMHLVVELSFLNICLTLLKLLVECFKTIDKRNETSSDDSFLLREKWHSFISRSNNSPYSSFCCSHCKVVNDLMQESGDNVDWSEYVKNYNYFHVRNFNKNITIDSTTSSDTLMNSCTNCDTKLSAKGQKDICNNVTCSQCDSWIQKFCSSEKQHEIELQTLETKYNAEIKQLEECIIKSSEMHEQEMLQKQNELLALTLQLQRLKTEYEEQKQMLKNFYEEKLNFECDSINEESIKDIYRAEIEDLKEMFKEGLVAIENSHSRITSEMERRHKEEVSLLEAEKQKALELEAQATLTALEAIKKSHAQQLIEQTSVIKKELMNKYHKGEEYLNLYNKYGNDLEKLKKEILKITDLYSSKCIENVDLEEKLNCLRQQLKEANNELSNLLCKNKEITSNLCIKT